MAAKGSLTVQIQGQAYRIASDGDPTGQQKVQRAAALVDETMAKIRERTGTIDTQNLAILAALNIANRFVSGHGPAPSDDVVDSGRIRALIELVESATGTAGAR